MCVLESTKRHDITCALLLQRANTEQKDHSMLLHIRRYAKTLVLGEVLKNAAIRAVIIP